MARHFILAFAAVVLIGCSDSRVVAQRGPEPSAAATQPPECSCCVFLEAPNDLSHQAILFPERAGVERVRIRGVIYESDGITPAAGTMMYFYHTDETGRYSKQGDEPRDSLAWWHGKQRSWLRTNDQGEYEIDTILPAPYPDRTEPAHIHAMVQSPRQKHCVNIADFVFQNDELLTEKFWENTESWWRSMGIAQDPDYGGVALAEGDDGVWEGVRDITLMSEFDLPALESGPEILAESPAFEPQHAWGPDRGSHACPMCKYGYQPGVLLWVNTDEKPDEIEQWAKWLEVLSLTRGDGNFKAYVIYTNPTRMNREQLEKKMSDFGRRLGLQKIAVTYVPSVDDRATDTHLNKINPSTSTTIIVYNKRKVRDKFVNLAFTDQNKALLRRAVERAGTEVRLQETKPEHGQ